MEPIDFYPQFRGAVPGPDRDDVADGIFSYFLEFFGRVWVWPRRAD
jgi:hypothetical protein